MTKGAIYAPAGMPAAQRRALERIAAQGPRVRVGPTILEALRANRMIYTAWDGRRRFVHLTPAGKEEINDGR